MSYGLRDGAARSGFRLWAVLSGLPQTLAVRIERSTRAVLSGLPFSSRIPFVLSARRVRRTRTQE